jgi:predicted nucleotide-binding protein
VELAAHWHEHVSEELGTDSENTIRDQVTCFFKVAEAANIGEYVVGRGGKQSRFVVNQDELGQFIAELGLEGDSEPKQEQVIEKNEEEEAKEEIDEDEEEHEVAPSDVADEVFGNGEDSAALEDTPGTEQAASATTEAAPDSEQESLKVFISHGKNMEVVEQIKTMLDLADLDFEVAVEEQTTAIPVPDKVLDAMRRCNAAVICVTADGSGDDGDGYSINRNVLIEIGAAFVLYEKKVVLVWDSRLDVPSNLQGLYRCEFEGDELSWSAGMRLMKAVNKFKDQ